VGIYNEFSVIIGVCSGEVIQETKTVLTVFGNKVEYLEDYLEEKGLEAVTSYNGEYLYVGHMIKRLTEEDSGTLTRDELDEVFSLAQSKFESEGYTGPLRLIYCWEQH